MSKGYKVGFKKTPRHTRFKPGRSGNPKGRPKGRKNIRTIIKDVLVQTVTITENGRVRRVKFTEALVRQLAAKALTGSTREQIAILKAIHDYVPELAGEPIEPKTVEIVFVEGKDGRPAPGQEFTDTEEDDEDPDDLSFLD